MNKKIIIKIKELITRVKNLRREYHRNKLFKKNLEEEDLKYLSFKERKKTKDYWKVYTKKYDFIYTAYYSARTKMFDKRYIPDVLYYFYIDKYFNNYAKSYGIDDKNYYDKLFPNLNQPQTLLRKINGYYYDKNYLFLESKEFKINTNPKKKYILKPSTEIESKGGKGILFIDNINTINLNELLLYSNNYIIQEQVKQHKVLENIHPSSLNTIRVVSLLYKEKVHILSSVLRVGISERKVDNGGIAIGIDEKGRLKKKGYKIDTRKEYIKHPDTGIVFKGREIPNYAKIINLVIKEAINFPDFKMISWDFSINENKEVLFIEFNLKNGQLDFHQLANGPLFGDLTEEVLEDVFLKSEGRSLY